jgi:hypothetical protein
MSHIVAYTKKNVTCWRTVWPAKEQSGMHYNRGLPKHDVTVVARGSMQITDHVLHILFKTVWRLCVHQHLQLSLVQANFDFLGTHLYDLLTFRNKGASEQFFCKRRPQHRMQPPHMTCPCRGSRHNGGLLVDA